MASSRTILIAGAGIGGLTAALALADQGFRVVVLEQATRLEETGAGIQISPNAARVLTRLGIADRLRSHVIAPEAIRIRTAKTGRDLARLPVCRSEQYYGAPFWTVHRGDLHGVLVAAVEQRPEIELRLDARVDDFTFQDDSVTATCLGRSNPVEERGLALVGADGLWSRVRARLGDSDPPRAAGKCAWRALIPAHLADPDLRDAAVHLWLGHGAHLVHYPVRGGSLINVVAIAADNRTGTGWSAPSGSSEVLQHFPPGAWAESARSLLALPNRWLRWSLHDRPPLRTWGRGPVTLLGDAAHPMLPFLAQGAGMAIEDAAVLADALGREPTEPAAAMRDYERDRRDRTADVQRASRGNDRRYHLGGPAAAARDLVLKYLMGGELLLSHYDWIYQWRPPVAAAAPRAVA